MTLRELIERALDMASTGQDSTAARLSMEAAIEPLLPVVFGEVSDRLAASRTTRTLLQRTQALAVANGSVALAQEVLTPYLCESTLLDPADITRRYAYLHWHQLVRDTELRLGRYALEGESTLHVVEPEEIYDPAAGPTVALELTTPCSVAVPALAGTIAARDEVVDELIKALATALRQIATK